MSNKQNIFDDFEVIDLSESMGDVVCCDFCNLGDDTMGGVMIGSNAVCGDCCKKNDYYFDKANDVDYYFDRNKTFKENVLQYRKKNKRHKLNSNMEFKISEDHPFKDSTKDIVNMQVDINSILHKSIEMEESSPPDYLDAVEDYLSRRPNVVKVLTGNYTDLKVGNVESLARKIAFMHLKLMQQQIAEGNHKVSNRSNKDHSVKIEAPRETGYKVYETASEQEKALKKVRESEEMRDIFPDIARA